MQSFISHFYRILAIVSGLVFLVLVYLVCDTNELMGTVNQSVYEYLAYSQVAHYSSFWKVITYLGGPVSLSLLTVLASLYFWYKKDIQDVYLYVFSMVGGFALVGLLKYYTASERPLFIHAIEETFSFPSGHTALSAIFLLLTGFVYSKGKDHRHQKAVFVIGLAISILIALSRLYLGEHWLSDVVGGYLLALSWAFGCIYFIDTRNKTKSI